MLSYAHLGLFLPMGTTSKTMLYSETRDSLNVVDDPLVVQRVRILQKHVFQLKQLIQAPNKSGIYHLVEGQMLAGRLAM